MGHEIVTEALINASIEQVWSALTDFERYPEWNTFVRSATGKLALGEKLRIRIHPPKGMPMLFLPRVTVYEEGRRFAWRGKLISSSLFAGEHRFELSPISPVRTKLVHAERFEGMLLPLLKGQLEKTARPGFELMNEQLKKRCEAQ